MSVLVSVLASLVLLLGGIDADVARAEECWRDRGRGFEATGRVDERPARCAADGFAAAAQAAPERLDLAFRAIEALWFVAHFAAAEPGRARADLDRAVELADRAADEVARRAGGAVHGPGADPERRAAALASVPEAGEAHFWRVVAWGEWSLVRGPIAAATGGAVGRLRESAELAAALAPGLRDGGGLRLLGRLHTTAPRVPLLTGWVDRRRGIDLLRAALRRSRRDPRNLLFLAEALLDHRPGDRAEATALLRELAGRAPDPAELVEQSETLAAARRRLERLEKEGA